MLDANKCNKVKKRSTGAARKEDTIYSKPYRSTREYATRAGLKWAACHFVFAMEFFLHYRYSMTPQG